METIYRVAACTDEQEPSVQVDWPTVTEAVDSFMELLDSYDVQITARTVALLLTLMLGDRYRNNNFQMLSADNRTVISITKISVGIPTPSER